MRLLLAVSVLLLFVSGSPAGRKPIIVLISIDTLRADHPGAYGYSQPTSPFLDSLAESGVLFEEASREEMVNREKQIRRYDSGVRHADEAVRQLHAFLAQKGLTKNAIFCVTSDHGEQIGE